MKIELNTDQINEISEDVIVDGRVDNSLKADITELVKDQLKVRVPEEMPWSVYEEYKKYLDYSWFTLKDMFDAVNDWAHLTGSVRKNTEHQLIIARAMQYGFKLAERKFRVPLKGLMTSDGEQQYVSFKIAHLDSDGVWNDCEGLFASRKIDSLTQSFTEQQLKDLNAPDWIMQLPREYVGE